MAGIEMIVVDGVRYRPEDAKARGIKPSARTLAGEPPVITDGADAAAVVDGAEVSAEAEFDPRQHNVEEVLAELSRVRGNADEVARIKALEDEGKSRVTITEWEPTS